MKKLIQKYTRLELRRRKLKVELNEVDAAMQEIEEPLLDAMEESGTQSISSNGITVYLKRQLWASPKRFENETVSEAHQRAFLTLTDWGWDDAGGLRINAQSLSSRVRKYLKDHDDLPYDLKQILNVEERVTLGKRKAS